jgi:hypothetical protein
VKLVLLTHRTTHGKGTSEMNNRHRRPPLSVTTGAKNVAAHAGARLLMDLADDVGLSGALSVALAPTKARRRGHDRGQVLVDLAVGLADGATAITDVARTFGPQPELFGPIASTATTWRMLGAIDDAALERIATARAQARREAWAAGADPRFYVIDIDATLIESHSEKDQAAPNYKHSFGFHPLLAYLDATGEPLAAILRPGNAGSGTGADHVEILDAALAQLPVDPRQKEMIVRADSAGCSHEFLEAASARGVFFFVGHRLDPAMVRAIGKVPESAWSCAISADGTEDADWAAVAELSDYLDLSGWPEGTRALVRREEAHPGAQLSFTDVDGHRYQVFLTDHDSFDLAFLEGVYRGRGRAECAIRDSKDTGLANLPSRDFGINQAWVTAVLIAGDLMAWTKANLLEGELAKATPRRLRYALFHAAGQLVRSGRRVTLRIAEGWAWADELVAAWGRLPSWRLTR